MGGWQLLFLMDGTGKQMNRSQKKEMETQREPGRNIKDTPYRGNHRCKDPEAAMCFMYLRNTKESSVAKRERASSVVEGGETR